jgi:GDA1/CD39 (nucleoside phosphatase) family
MENMLGDGKTHPYTKDSKLAYRCMEALYMVTLLEHGFGFDGQSRNITLALEVSGNEVEWTLGFALAEVPFAFGQV